MPLVAEIGEAVKTLREMTFEWRIANPFSLSDEVGDYYESPVFSFAGSLWRLRLYPNGDTDDLEEQSSTDNDGRGGDSPAVWVGLFLRRDDDVPRITINYTFGIQCSDGVEEKDAEEGEFSSKYNIWGLEEFWSRVELLFHASRLVPNNFLTITCRLKCSELEAAKVSFGSRVREVSRHMKTMLADAKRTDFTLKLGDREWPVHKVILESRCQYFANMFRHGWVENTVGEVTFEDVEEDALGIVLDFVYSGDVEDMSIDNVCETYVAAHKFILDDLKAVCVEYMKGDMCLKIFCKAIIIADTYGEEDLRQSAVEYFMLKKDRIFDSKKWKELKKNHGSVAADFLEEIAKKEK